MREGYKKALITVCIVSAAIFLSSFFKANSQIRTHSTRNDSVTLPIRGMFYYPWFPETWGRDLNTPFTHYHPTLGLYSSSDASVVSKHIQAMQYANVQVGIFEWNGQGTLLDHRIPLLLKTAKGTGFHWAVYYDQEGLNIGFGSNPTAQQIAGDLQYLNRMYTSDASYTRINGRPVIFVYGDPGDNCGMVERWKQANVGINDYIVLKVFPGYTKCSSQPDGWHQYNPENREDSQAKYSFTVSPGFWESGQPTPRLVRDTDQFTQSVQHMVASHAPFQLITTFNEWGEGSAVEKATEWGGSTKYGTYLDILHLIPTKN